MTEYYPEDAIKRISALSSRDILNFLESLRPASQMQVFASYRPGGGFRENPAGARQVIQSIARRLSGEARGTPAQNKKDQRAFRLLWRSWLIENLGDEDFVADALDEWLDAVKREDDEVATDEEVMEAAVGFFTKLVSLTERNICSREELDQAFLFGPFKDADRVRQEIKKAKSQEEVNKSLEVGSLPSRVSQLAERVQKLADRSMNNENSIGDLRDLQRGESDKIDRFDSRITKIGVEIARLESSVDDVRREFSQFQKDSHHHDDLSLVTEKEFSRSAIEADRKVDMLSQKINDLDSKVVDSVNRQGKIDEKIRAFLASVDQLDDRQSQLSETLSNIAVEGERSSPQIITQAAEAPTSVKRVVLSEQATSVLVGVDSIRSNLEQAYTQVGMRKSYAVSCANEVLSGLLCEQVVLFRGAYAGILMELTCRAIACERTMKINVPISSVDEDQVALIEEDLKAFEAEAPVVALAIKNINRLPLELFGPCLGDRWFRRALGFEPVVPHYFALATIDDGGSGLPISGLILDVGPMIDSEAMRWAMSEKEGKPDRLGEIGQGAWVDMLLELGTHDSPIPEEIDDAFSEFSIEPTSNWRKRLGRVLGVLDAVGEEGSLTQSTQSLVKSWILPKLLAEGKVKREEVPEFLELGGVASSSKR